MVLHSHELTPGTRQYGAQVRLWVTKYDHYHTQMELPGSLPLGIVLSFSCASAERLFMHSFFTITVNPAPTQHRMTTGSMTLPAASELA